jgi:hypothetical protein
MQCNVMNSADGIDMSNQWNSQSSYSILLLQDIHSDSCLSLLSLKRL